MLLCARFSLLVWILLFAVTTNAAQTVLVSVHPLALLIKSAWPTLNVTSLVASNQSPHDFSLKPSDMRRVVKADMVIWIGSDIEPFLVNLMRNKDRQIQLSHLVEEEKAKAGEYKHSEDKHGHHEPHLWLQPDTIPSLLAVVQKRMGLPAPTEFLIQYTQWLKATKLHFTDIKERGFISYHDAFHPWVEYFGLNQLDVVTHNPEKPVGTRHVVQIRKILESGVAHCVFVEPQFQGRLLDKLTQGLKVKRIKIDPLASSYQVESANFLSFYYELTAQFQRCLSL
jgi:zinc transport system substrate-binding protein